MNNESLEYKKICQKEMTDDIINKSIKELLSYFTESEITKNEVYSDIKYNVNQAFQKACDYSNFELMSFLLFSPEISIHADIHYEDEKVLSLAMSKNYNYLVEFLLTSPRLKTHCDIYKNIDQNFEYMLNNLCPIWEGGIPVKISSISPNLDTLNYLIYDFLLIPTPKIIELLKEKAEFSIYESAIAQLNSNLLFNQMNEKINEKYINSSLKVNKKKI